MPYDIKKVGSKYCVINKETGRNTGCSDSLEMATKHLRALYAAESSYEGGNHDVRYQHSAIDSSVGSPVGSYVHGSSDGLGLVMQDTNSLEPMIEIDRTQDGEPIMVPLSQVRVGPSKPVFAARSEDIAAVAQAFNVPANTTPTSIVAPRPNPPQQPRPQVVEQQVATSVQASEHGMAYVGGSEVYEHQITQEQANYNALGATKEKGCANCQWFVNPDACVLVHGDIAPNGLSSLWRAKEVYTPTPLPVEVVSVAPDIKWGTSERVLPVQDGFLQRIIDAGKSFTGTQAIPIEKRPFELYKVRGILKGEDGIERTVEQLRFVAYWSNRYVDRSGSPIPLAAHERAIARVDEQKSYPVLLQWHSIGTEYGQVDCMDISEGFNVAFGYILPGKEEIAYKVAERKDIGMSHGSLYKVDRINGDIIDFYPFELTTLPVDYAKNSWTSIDIGRWAKEKDMPFAPEKIAYLKSVGMTDEQIAQSETKTTQFKTQLAELGIEFKGDEPPDTASLMEAIGSMAEQNKAMREELDALKAQPTINAVATGANEGQSATNPDGSTGDVTAQNSDMQSLVDAAVAKALAGAQGGQAVHIASKSDDNVTGKVPVNNQANLSGWGERPAETFLKTALGNAVKLNGQS